MGDLERALGPSAGIRFSFREILECALEGTGKATDWPVFANVRNNNYAHVVGALFEAAARAGAEERIRGWAI